MKQSDKDREGSEEVQGHRAKTCKPSQQFLSLTGISLQRPLYLSSSPNSEGILGSGVAGRRIEGKEYLLLQKKFTNNFSWQKQGVHPGFRKHRIFYHTGCFKGFGVFVTQQNSVLHH